MFFVCLFFFISLAIFHCLSCGWMQLSYVHLGAWTYRCHCVVSPSYLYVHKLDIDRMLRVWLCTWTTDGGFVQYYIDNNRFHSFLLGSFLTLPFRTKLRMGEQASEAFSHENGPQNPNSNRRGEIRSSITRVKKVKKMYWSYVIVEISVQQAATTPSPPPHKQ